MTWTAPEIERHPSPKLVDERTALQGWLDFHRETLLAKCSGLTHEQLALRSVEPSRLSLLSAGHLPAAGGEGLLVAVEAGDQRLRGLHAPVQIDGGNHSLQRVG